MISLMSAARVNSNKSFLLRGNYAEGNFGDDALAVAAERLLMPHARRILTDGEVAYKDPQLDRALPRKGNDERFDAIVYGGGTQFFSFEYNQAEGPSSLSHRLLRKLTHPSSLIESYRARRKLSIESRTPLMAIGFGVGPFVENDPAERAVAILLKRMKLVWVRDNASMEFCERHGIETALRSSDLCFTTAFTKAVRRPLHTPKTVNAQRQIGLILRDWRAWNDTYFEAVIEAARRLREQGLEPKFFSLSSSDVRFLSVLQRNGESAISWRGDAGGLGSFWAAIAQMDLVVTARFHGAVFSVLSETPFLAISIEPKLDSVQQWAPRSQVPHLMVQPVADPELIKWSILNALDQMDQRRVATQTMLKEQCRLAMIGECRLVKILDELVQL